MLKSSWPNQEKNELERGFLNILLDALFVTKFNFHSDHYKLIEYQITKQLIHHCSIQFTWEKNQ